MINWRQTGIGIDFEKMEVCCGTLDLEDHLKQKWEFFI